MKLKPYHSIIIFAILVMSAIFASVDSYHRTRNDIINDMDRALVLTIQENQHQWITPDTIQNYRSHLSIDLLKQTSNLCYVVKEEDKRGENQLSSREMRLHQYTIQGYANCSMLDVFGMSNQHTSLSLSLMAMLWGIWSLFYYNKRNKQQERTERLAVKAFGALAYSAEEDSFFNQESHQTIKFTPMQHQLMQLFMQNTRHQLSKQEICESLWPKKPDANETLYTLIRRIKPIIESNCNLKIESERGKSYRLTTKKALSD